MKRRNRYRRPCESGRYTAAFAYSPSANGSVRYSLFQFQARLFFDAPERSFRNVLPGMRDGHPPWFRRVLELDMTSLLRDLDPTICFQSGNYVFRVYAHRYTSDPLPCQVYKYTSIGRPVNSDLLQFAHTAQIGIEPRRLS